MPKRSTGFRKISSFAIGRNICTKSADTFKRKLERDYFANVDISNVDDSDQRSNLVIEFHSNFSLVEFLYQIQKRNIGQLSRNINEELQDLSFSEALKQFRGQNDRAIDLEEINFFLSDCEITIKKIYPNSIEDQLGNIYKMLATHYKYFTFKQSRQPSEIFIPVFEENLVENFKPCLHVEESVSTKQDYFNFWGIYFSHNDDAVIYDLSTRSIISGDLYMLD